MTYSLGELDKKMLKYLNFNNGFFIEAGANDGISQSNTFLYEKKYGWSGLLIEPNPSKCLQCKDNRPNSIVENYALVSSNYKNDYIEGDFGHTGYADSLMAMVLDEGDWCDDVLRDCKKEKKENSSIIEVPAISLDKLLEKHNIKKIDFFSLDVEGYEISVLNGFDIQKFSPTYMLIETTTYEDRKNFIFEYMKDRNYKVIEQLSVNDYLFGLK
jgi:FkbM family methyltransferase